MVNAMTAEGQDAVLKVAIPGLDPMSTGRRHASSDTPHQSLRLGDQPQSPRGRVWVDLLISNGSAGVPLRHAGELEYRYWRSARSIRRAHP